MRTDTTTLRGGPGQSHQQSTGQMPCMPYGQSSCGTTENRAVPIPAPNREPAGVLTPQILAFANRKVGSQCELKNTWFFSANRDDNRFIRVKVTCGKGSEPGMNAGGLQGSTLVANVTGVGTGTVLVGLKTVKVEQSGSFKSASDQMSKSFQFHGLKKATAALSLNHDQKQKVKNITPNKTTQSKKVNLKISVHRGNLLKWEKSISIKIC